MRKVGYINDQAFYERALKRLKASGTAIGYSVSFVDGKSSCEINFGEKGFVHMGAVMGVTASGGIPRSTLHWTSTSGPMRFKPWLIPSSANQRIATLSGSARARHDGGPTAASSCHGHGGQFRKGLAE